METIIGKPKFKNGKLIVSGKKYPTKREENENEMFKKVYELLLSTEDGKETLKKLGLKTKEKEKNVSKTKSK